MHQVLQRTRPAPPPSPGSSSRLGTLFRSLFAGKRGLVLFAVLGGAALTSQAFHGLRSPWPQRAPGTSAGPGGRDGASTTTESSAASTAEPAVKPSDAGVATPAAAGQPTQDRIAGSRPSLAAEPARAVPGQFQRPRQSAAPAVAAAATAPSRPSLARSRPWRSRPNDQSREAIITEAGSESLPPAAPVAAEAPPQARPAAASSVLSGVRQLGTVTLADVDPTLGVPCSDTTAALPSDRPSEEAWLPGSDASSAPGSVALDPIPLPPIYSESPDPAAGLSPRSLQANRNTPCLLKQPAGRN